MLVLAAASGCSSGSSQDDYAKAYTRGLEAYTYGLPLLVTNKTFLTMTSVNVSNGAFGPVNQFNNVRTLNNPDSTAVVAPGANGLSSIAWLDLTQEPQVLQVPQVTDHVFVLALLDPYTEDLRNLGSANDTQPGDYVICGPGQHDARLPAGTQRVDVDYTRIWIIGSTQLKGESDLANVQQDPGRLHDYAAEQVRHRLSARGPRRIRIPRSRYIRCPPGWSSSTCSGSCSRSSRRRQPTRTSSRVFAAVGIGPGHDAVAEHPI